MPTIDLPQPDDDRWPLCGDPFCWRFDAEWWPEALEQRELDNTDAEVASPLPRGLV